MSRAALVVGVVAVLVGSACQSYEPIQDLNRRNQEYLRRLEIRLSLQSTEAEEYRLLPEARKAEFLKTKRQANLEALRRLFTDPSAVQSRVFSDMAALFRKYGVASTTAAADRPAELNAELADLQERYYRELDDVKRRAAIVDGYAELIKALQALQASADRIDDYLRMGTFERLYTEARALDSARLEKIGDDLKVVGERLQPLVLPK